METLVSISGDVLDLLVRYKIMIRIIKNINIAILDADIRFGNQPLQCDYSQNKLNIHVCNKTGYSLKG